MIYYFLFLFTERSPCPLTQFAVLFFFFSFLAGGLFHVILKVGFVCFLRNRLNSVVCVCVCFFFFEHPSKSGGSVIKLTVFFIVVQLLVFRCCFFPPPLMTMTIDILLIAGVVDFCRKSILPTMNSSTSGYSANGWLVGWSGLTPVQSMAMVPTLSTNDTTRMEINRTPLSSL